MSGFPIIIIYQVGLPGRSFPRHVPDVFWGPVPWPALAPAFSDFKLFALFLLSSRSLFVVLLRTLLLLCSRGFAFAPFLLPCAVTCGSICGFITLIELF